MTTIINKFDNTDNEAIVKIMEIFGRRFMRFPEEAREAINRFEMIGSRLDPAIEEEATVNDCIAIFVIAYADSFMTDTKAGYYAFALSRDIHAAGDLYEFVMDDDDRISDRMRNLIHIFANGHSDYRWHAKWIRGLIKDIVMA